VRIENADGTLVADVPDSLARLVIERHDWHKTRRSVPARDPLDFGKARDEDASVVTEAEDGEAVEDGLDPAATCDDELPEGITFADSAYETVVDPATGEKVRVLKTHCRNGHEYAGNVKLRLRGDKAYRECQTCLAGRRTRAKEKAASA
jgi:hypothetical protein